MTFQGSSSQTGRKEHEIEGVTPNIKAAAKRIGVPLYVYIDNINSGLKWCSSCKQWEPISAFTKDKSRKDGLESSCRFSRIQKPINTPNVIEKEQHKQIGLSWCRGCQDWADSKVVHHGLCREHKNQAYRLWYENGGKFSVRPRVYVRKRKLQKIDDYQKKKIFRFFDGKCAYCGAKATTLDHIVSFMKGGGSCLNNLVPACISCNSSKKDIPLDVWMNLNSIPQKILDVIFLGGDLYDLMED